MGDEVDSSETVEEEKRKGFCLEVGEGVWTDDTEIGEEVVTLDFM